MTTSTVAHAGPASPAQPPSVLATDHRDSFGRTLFGVDGTPDARQLAGKPSAKELVFTGARQAAESTTGPGQLAILVDEQFGADITREARKAGFVLAMPVETSGADALTYEYAATGAEPRGSLRPAWMTQALLAEADALRAGQ